MNFAILGAGAWGTAMAVHLQRMNHTVTLVPRRVEHALEISSSRENSDYLPGVTLPHSLQIGSELKPALMEAEVVLMACPSHALRQLCSQVSEVVESSWSIHSIVSLCKGLEKETFLRPTQVIEEVLPKFSAAVLSGPSFASEVARGMPTAVTLASKGDDGEQLQEAISDQHLRVYLSDDVVGVEMGGCLKNIYAIAAGICDGLELGESAKASLLTRALAEMVRLSKMLGGKTETLYGLSGVGDLTLTASSTQSRNYTFGNQIATGGRASDLIANQKTVVEGYFSAKVFYDLCQSKELDAPILIEVFRVLYEDLAPAQALQNLMSRNLKQES